MGEKKTTTDYNRNEYGRVFFTGWATFALQCGVWLALFSEFSFVWCTFEFSDRLVKKKQYFCKVVNVCCLHTEICSSLYGYSSCKLIHLAEKFVYPL